VAVWTQRLHISWGRPLVSFVSETAAILKDLEEAGLLWRYALSEERVGVKVGDALNQLVFEPRAMAITVFKPEPDMPSLLSAGEIVWGRLAPPEARRMEAEFRFINPLEGDYDELRERAGATVIPMPNGVRNVDFAVHADLATEYPSATVQIECGIVQQQEARTRLAMHQEALRPEVGVPPSIFDLKSLPDVAVFGRQVWQVAEPEIATWNDATSIWSSVSERAAAVDVALFERMKGDAK
jgi:hypothetical protein